MWYWPLDMIINTVVGITVFDLVIAFSIAILAYMVLEDEILGVEKKV